MWSDVSVQPSTPSRRGALCENLPKFGRLHSTRRGTHCGDRGAPKGRVKQLRMHGNRVHSPSRPDQTREPVSARWFPVPRKNTGKFADLGLEPRRLGFRKKIQSLTNRIQIPSRLNRENLWAIREPEADNSEPYPNNGPRCLAPHDLRPQVQILGSQPALFAPRPSDTLDGGGRFKLHLRVGLVPGLERSRKPLYG